MKNKWKKTLLLLLIFFILFGTGGICLLFVQKWNQKDLSFPYDVSEQMYGMQDSLLNIQKADAYASDLCVSADDVTSEGISFTPSVKAALFNLESDEVTFAQNIHEKAYPASITKIMTAIVALKYGNLDDVVTISEQALHLEEGSMEIGFQAGDQVVLRELLYGLLIFSGNDAAMAIAEHVGGSIEQFVSMMNQEAANIGATNTHFVNPTGLQDEEHYTTVYDIYLMLETALQYDLFVKIIQLDTYTMSYTRGETSYGKRLDSTDQYLTRQVTPPKNVTVLGGKTGTTSDAGSCLALVSQNAYGELFISIILKASAKTQLYEYMNLLLSQINL